MIKNAIERRPNYRRRPAGLRGLGAVSVTMYAAPSATNPQQVAVTGLPAAGIQTAHDPEFFLSAAVAQSFVDQLNAQSATNASQGAGLMQTVIPELATLPDEILCPLMSHGCVTQAQIGSPARVAGCTTWLYAHPEMRGSGIPDAYCAQYPQYNPLAVSTATQPQITLTNSGATLPGWSTQGGSTGTGTGTDTNTTTQTQTPAGGNSTTPPAGNNTTTPPAGNNNTPPADTGDGAQAGDPGADTGKEVIGDPRGIFDEIIATLPPSLRDVIETFRRQTASIPAWVWAIVAGAILFWIESRRRRNRR